jgi:hypothetical protein
MSYFNMHHAAWVEENNSAGRKHSKPKRDKDGRPVGYHAAPEKLTEAQARACEILGIVGGGIYNAPITWESVDWMSGRGISVTWHGSLATFDFVNLTNFVLLCHEGRMRGNISSSGPRSIRLTLSQRTPDGCSMDRHPGVDEMLAAFKAQLGSNHRVSCRELEATP